MSNNDLVKAEPITPYQLKAARALLGWSRLHLALRSDTSEHIVTTYEKAGRVAGQCGQSELDDPIGAIRATLEAAGVEFANGEASGGAAAQIISMTPGQVQVARKLLGWSRTQLSACSGTSVHAVQAFERTGHVANLYGQRTEQVDAIAAIRATLEAAGIEFSSQRMPGVRGRTPTVKLRKHVDCEAAEARRVTSYQLKAARALLGWSKMHLALRSATSEHIVATYEKTGQVAGLPDQMDQGDPIAAIRATLEAAGVEFITACTPRVRLRKLGQ